MNGFGDNTDIQKKIPLTAFRHLKKDESYTLGSFSPMYFTWKSMKKNNNKKMVLNILVFINLSIRYAYVFSI